MRRIAAWLVLLVAMSACEVTNSDPIFTLYVAPDTVECMGVAPQQCLLVKEDADDEWTYFYDGIEGFTYEYRLLQVVSKKQAT